MSRTAPTDHCNGMQPLDSELPPGLVAARTMPGFLAARIREEEERADARRKSEPFDGWHPMVPSPELILKQVAAIRCLIAKREQVPDVGDDVDYWYGEGLDAAMRWLASAWSNHPDYNEDWTP